MLGRWEWHCVCVILGLVDSVSMIVYNKIVSILTSHPIKYDL
jgi:hypothetical protein